MSWPTIVGADLAALARPEQIKWPRGNRGPDEGQARPRTRSQGSGAGATLTVACEPAHALEISYKATDILDRINRHFGYAAIAQLRVVQRLEEAVPAKGASQEMGPLFARGPAKSGDFSQALEALRENVRRAARQR